MKKTNDKGLLQKSNGIIDQLKKLDRVFEGDFTQKFLYPLNETTGMRLNLMRKMKEGKGSSSQFGENEKYFKEKTNNLNQNRDKIKKEIRQFTLSPPPLSNKK